MPRKFGIGITVAGQLPIYTEFPDLRSHMGTKITNINYVKEQNYVNRLGNRLQKVKIKMLRAFYCRIRLKRSLWLNVFVQSHAS